MNITKKQFERIAPHFPTQRGNVKIDNYTFISAILYMAENGCERRALPDKFGSRNSIYQRFKRWAESGVMQMIFAALQAEQIISISVETLTLDSASRKVHPDTHGALKKEENNLSASPKAAGTPSFMWYPQMIRSSLKRASLAENAKTVQRGESQ
jgi:transposase